MLPHVQYMYKHIYVHVYACTYYYTERATLCTCTCIFYACMGMNGYYRFLPAFTLQTKEAALGARELIEFTRELQYIPRDLAGKVIGRGGNIVQQILEKSKLNNIKVIGDEEAKEKKLDTQGNVRKTWLL